MTDEQGVPPATLAVHTYVTPEQRRSPWRQRQATPGPQATLVLHQEMLPAIPATALPKAEEPASPRYSMQQLLMAAGKPRHVPVHFTPSQLAPAAFLEQPPMPDSERREAAKVRLKDAVLKQGQNLLAEQIRYELALQAKNGNAIVMGLFETEARILEISIDGLAQRIIDDRRAEERRMMHLYAVMARVSAAIDRATGDGIDEWADAGVAEIGKREE